ncbi:Transposase and inactivated derivatives [uncultured Gammaproteobacteria bacterium]|nr:Transposase and inactivated derivatives [uncultured Gammaproteobacteria bacterium]
MFTRLETVNILLESLNFLSKERLKTIEFVVLENHAHLILQGDNLSKDIMRFKAHTAKKLLAYLSQNNIRQILEQLAFYKKAHKSDRQYQFWQEWCHPELI